MDNRKNNGGHSTNGFAGRHSKSTEQEVIENLSFQTMICPLQRKVLESNLL